MTKLEDIEGVGKVYAEKLGFAGVSTEEHLLTMGATPKGRKEIAEKAGIGEAMILEWVNRADLARVKGIGSEYADLLEAAGVDTVVELSKRMPANLLAKMTEVNEAKKLVRKLPVLSQVEAWVKEAKELPRVVSY